MKKSLLLLLMVLVLSVAAAAHADKGLSSAYPAESVEAACAERLADLLDLPLLPVPEEDPGNAANLMLADPECVLAGSQDVLIAGLQGYTNEDLREAMAPVCSLAVSPLFLVMDRDIAAEMGISDLSSLLDYTASHEYDLTFARHISADPVDLAVTRLADGIAVLTDYYLEEEIPDILHSGEAAAGVFSGADLAAAEEDWLVLCCLSAERSPLYADVPSAAEAGLSPCDGVLLCLFMSAEASDESIAAVAEAAASLQAEDLPAGYLPCYAPGDAFSETVRKLFADYKEYMTSEGLFFYEE